MRYCRGWLELMEGSQDACILSTIIEINIFQGGLAVTLVKTKSMLALQIGALGVKPKCTQSSLANGNE